MEWPIRVNALTLRRKFSPIDQQPFERAATEWIRNGTNRNREDGEELKHSCDTPPAPFSSSFEYFIPSVSSSDTHFIFPTFVFPSLELGQYLSDLLLTR